jgi:hypothetical protein
VRQLDNDSVLSWDGESEPANTGSDTATHELSFVPRIRTRNGSEDSVGIYKPSL